MTTNMPSKYHYTSFLSQWSKLLTIVEIMTLGFIVSMEGSMLLRMESYYNMATSIASVGVATTAVVMGGSLMHYYNFQQQQQPKRTTLIATIALHVLVLFGILVIYYFTKESGMTIIDEISARFMSSQQQVPTKKKMFGLFGGKKKKPDAVANMTLSSYMMDSTNWNMKTIIIPAIVVEIVLVTVTASIAFVMTSKATTTGTRTTRTTSSVPRKNSTTTTTTTSSNTNTSNVSIPSTGEMERGSLQQQTTTSKPPLVQDAIDQNVLLDNNEPKFSSQTSDFEEETETTAIFVNEEPPMLPSPPPTPPTPPKSPGTDTSNNGACYLVYEPDSSGRLVEYYSKTPVEGAVGMWVAGEGYTMPEFKFTPSNCRTVVIGNCSAGVIGRKNYCSGWCSFLRTAQLMNGWVTLWDPSTTKGLAVDVYIYHDDSSSLLPQTVQLDAGGTPVNVGNASAVACLPKNSRFHGGINGIPMNKWMEDGRSKGASSMIKKIHSATPSRLMGNVGNTARMSLASNTSSTPMSHQHRVVFGSRTENTNNTPSSTTRKISFNTPAKNPQETAANRSSLLKNVAASTLSMERVRHRTTAATGGVGPVDHGAVTTTTTTTTAISSISVDENVATAAAETAGPNEENNDSDAARLIQIMMSKGYSIHQVETELLRQTQGNIPNEIAHELQRFKAAKY